MSDGIGRKLAWISAGAAAMGGLWVAVRATPPRPSIVAPAPAPTIAPPETDEPDEDTRSYSFRMPSGEPTALACGEARRIVEQVRAGLAYEPEAIAPAAFAESTTDWLDPHELWALATDAPTSPTIDKHAADLIGELEGRKLDDCDAARAVAEALVPWVAELRGVFDAARAEPGSPDASGDALRATLVAPGTTRVVARELAASLGHRAGAVERAMGDAGKPYATAARDRFFPELDAEGWSKVVLAAAVRAYVPLVDPHGAWAPFDEEASVYEVELSARPPSRLWQSGDFTALGFRLREGAAAPLAKGDVLLAVAGVPIAGLPLEQLDQLGFAAAEAHGPETAVLVREGETAPRTVMLTPADDTPPQARDHDPLPAERVAFGDGDALVVTIRDVRDDLGDQLARSLHEARGHGDGRPLAGVVLDLRGNGGGSTDGAIDALGLFLPGVPLFPMKRRDGTVETDRAPEPPLQDRWTGPVATLVDGSTASAAEMIAGALATYHRGPHVGAPTYGKGCAQEYIDDDARAGVLRLTTLLYALPDGTPVQKVGLSPLLRLPFAGGATDREATLAHAAPTWRGPDVRQKLADLGPFAWPSHAGAVGPCKDADLCRALRAIGAGGKRPIAAKR
jgi:carboxyl-terminal processing protease